jgi:hypothetical protein
MWTWTAGDVSSLMRRSMAKLRPLVVPLIVALPPLLWVREAAKHAALETLGRDQGIFQYIAWAIQHGAKDYRDVRDVNGPLTHLIHMGFLALGGADEHRFRLLDLVLTGTTFSIVGACLPGLSQEEGDTPPTVPERMAWALAGMVILGAQYMHYIFWDQAQRESFFNWFMLTSTAIQLYAQSKPRAAHPRLLLGLAGALSLIPWFGKPTYALFTLAQLATLLVDRQWSVPLRARFSSFLLGAALGSLTQVAYLLVFADVGAFLHIYFVDVPALYRFIWPRTPLDILSLSGYASTAGFAIVTSVAVIGLIVDGQVPARILAIALMPLLGLVSVVIQAKGFPYHFHPVSAGLYLEWLVIVVWLWERYGRRRTRSEESGAVGMVRLVPFAAAGALALAVTTGVQASSHLTNHWILAKGISDEQRHERDYLVYFRTSDFFPWEMREVARYLQEHTRPTDRVQEYGMDAYLLFLAERRSATPYIYAYDLNVDAALYGSDLPEGLHPDGQESQRIREIRDAHERDLLAKLKSAPPAAFVFMDRAPLMTEDEDAWKDFVTHNAEAAPWVAEHYKQTAVFGDDRIWLRRDLSEGIAEVTGQGMEARTEQSTGPETGQGTRPGPRQGTGPLPEAHEPAAPE